MKTRVLVVIAVFAACMASVGLTDEALAKQIQVVTARGNVFSLADVEVGWMNNNTGGTTIINNIINNAPNSTGAGVGFGYLPQIVIHDTPGAIMMWGNTTHAGHGAERPYMREGVLGFAGMVEQDDRSVTIQLPSLSGEYRLQGEDRLTGSNHVIEDTYSSWDDAGGWLELAGDPNIGGPNTVVARLNDYQLTRQPINVTGWASPGTTVQIVSSPNDLTQHTIVGDGFAPEVLPIDSYLNYTKTLVNTQYSSNSRLPAGNINTDLLECVEGRSDTYTTRGYRCHDYAYPSYPASIHTDFYTKDCGTGIDIDANVGHTRGVYSSTPQNPDYSYWTSGTLTSPPVIDCGPKVDGYHHVTRIEQNQTATYGGTYRFGPLTGTYEGGEFLQEIHGNVTLNTSDHDVHFTGTGLFEETVDARPLVYTPTTVTFSAWAVYVSPNSWVTLSLESPDGQITPLTSSYFLYSGRPSVTITETVELRDAVANGDWILHASSSFCTIRSFNLGTWTLTIDGVDFTGSGGRINCGDHTYNHSIQYSNLRACYALR